MATDACKWRKALPKLYSTQFTDILVGGKVHYGSDTAARVLSHIEEDIADEAVSFGPGGQHWGFPDGSVLVFYVLKVSIPNPERHIIRSFTFSCAR